MSAGIESVAAITGSNSIKTAYGNAAPAPRRFGIPPLPYGEPRIADIMKPAPASEAAARLREQFQQTAEEQPDIAEVVDYTNRQLALSNRSLRFRIDRDTEELQIQVIDADRGKIIRSIPSDEMLRLASRLRELSGIGAMVDQSR